jgi:hypothetical protein
MSNRRKPHQPETFADQRAQRTSVREAALMAIMLDPSISEYTAPDAPDIEGFTAWSVGPAVVLMPTLLPEAPSDAVRVYAGRIIANATGVCPACSEVVEDKREGIIDGELAHDDQCPIYLFDGMEQWLDPTAVAVLRGEQDPDVGG